jgi:glycosyltransferase involved in cell wall biosynthesis
MLGVPSIIYDVSSLNETVRDGVTGFVVPRGDISAMEAKLKLLKEDSQLREDMSKAAKGFAKELFSEKNYQRIKYAILEDTASLR